MALATVSDVKGILGITASTQDAQITALLAPTQGILERMVGTLFDSAARVEDYDGLGQERIVVGYPPIAASPAPIVKDDLDRVFGADSVVSSSLLSIDYDAGIVRIDTSNTLAGWATFGGIGFFRNGNKNVRVSYTGPAWSAAQLASARLILSEMIAYSLNRISQAGITSESIGAYSYSAAQFNDAHLSFAAREALKEWRRVALPL